MERKIGQQALEVVFFEAVLAADREQRELLALTGKPLSVSPSAVGYRPPEEVETCLPEPQGKGQGISMSFRGMGKSFPMDI